MIFLWTLVIAFLGVFYFKEALERKKRRVPSGPWPLPLIGNVHQLALAHSRSDLAIAALSAKYGEIYHLKLGFFELVILASDEAIHNVLVKKEAMGRDVRGTLVERNRGQNVGLGFSDGPKWERLRFWTMKSLKDYGFNKTSSMEASIQEDLELMFEKTDESLGPDGTGIISVANWFSFSSFTFLWKMLVGHFTPEDEPLLNRLILKGKAATNSGLVGVGIINAFPFMRLLFPNWTGHNTMMEFYDEIYGIAVSLLREAQSEEIEEPQNFIQAFAKKMKQVSTENTDEDNCFKEHDFAILFTDLVQAGSDTSSSYLESIMLHMILHPDVQAKVYAEIQNTIPQGQPVAFSYSKLMPYTQAVMLETHRHTKVAQNFLPRRALQDIQYKDYVIPKGTIMISDIHPGYYCPENFKDPTAFKPERFIGPKGEFINHPSVIPFGVGKRNCIAKNVAEVSTFLIFVSVLRKYELSTVRGEPIPVKEMHVGFTSRPYAFNAAISKRS